MAKKKTEKSPEKVESQEIQNANENAEKIHVVDDAKNQESDLAKHPKFAKFISHGGK